MALVVADRVKETTTTTGTGTVTLAGAETGFQSFAAVGDGNTTYYAIVDSGAGDWEVGLGTYTASGTTLSRDTVISSSNAGSAVSFSAGSKDVFVTYPSGKAVYEDASGDVTVPAALNSQTITTTSTATLGGDTTITGDVLPNANNTYDLGSSSLRWANIYTNDLHLSNGIGDYTVVEGEEDLFLHNNKTGKVFKFALIEVDPSESPPKAEK
jgi:hypothetical protein